MKTYQFTICGKEIISLIELKEVLNISLVLENKEGIYLHGKVTAFSKEEAKLKLESI